MDSLVTCGLISFMNEMCYQGFSQRPIHLSFGHPILILDTLKCENLL